MEALAPQRDSPEEALYVAGGAPPAVPPSRTQNLGPAPAPPPAWMGSGGQPPEEEEDNSDMVQHLDPNERRHSSLGDLDLDDVHDIHEGDLAMLDDGKEAAANAGIIDETSGVPRTVQPAEPAPPAAAPEPDFPLPEATTEPYEVVRRKSRIEQAQRRSSRLASLSGSRHNSLTGSEDAPKQEEAVLPALEEHVLEERAHEESVHDEGSAPQQAPEEPKRRSSRIGALVDKVVTSTRSLSARQMVTKEEPAEATHVNLKARTLAGKIFALDHLERTITFFELRELIHEAIPNIPVSEQRLLFRGKIIDATPLPTTLREMGFKDGDLIHVVRQLSSNASLEAPSPPQHQPQQVLPPMPQPLWGGPQPSQQQPPQQHSPPLPSVHQQPSVHINQSSSDEAEIITVLVPLGRHTGDRLRIHPPGRAPMLVTVPEGVYEGMPFRVQLPPLSADLSAQQQQPSPLPNNRVSLHANRQSLSRAPPPQQQPIPSQQQAPSSPQPAGRLMAVVVPPRYRAGMVMEIMVPNKGRMRVIIPDGVRAGQQFTFRVPN